MKTLKTILLLLIISNFSFSQINTDIGIEFYSPTTDTVIGPDFTSIIKITNHGYDTVQPGYRYKFWYTINNQKYSAFGEFNQESFIYIPLSLVPNIPMLFNFNFPFDSIRNLRLYNKVCISYKFASSSDTDYNASNDYDCFTFKYTNFNSITENKIKDNFKITNSNSFIIIDSKLNESYQYHLFSMNGKLIETSQSFEDKRIDVSHLKRGMYFIRITNDRSSFSKKIMIQ